MKARQLKAYRFPNLRFLKLSLMNSVLKLFHSGPWLQKFAFSCPRKRRRRVNGALKWQKCFCRLMQRSSPCKQGLIEHTATPALFFRKGFCGLLNNWTFHRIPMIVSKYTYSQHLDQILLRLPGVLGRINLIHAKNDVSFSYVSR